MLPDGQKVRSLRENHPWTQDELAVASGTTSRTIQRIEAGKGVSIESLRAVASALQVDFERLLAPKASAAEPNATTEEVKAQFEKHYEIRRQLDQTLTELTNYWEERASGWRLTQAEKKDLEKWLGSFSPAEGSRRLQGEPSRTLGTRTLFHSRFCTQTNELF